MKLDKYEEFLQRIEDDPHPCIHGHINCSDRKGGPCCDEECPDDYED